MLRRVSLGWFGADFTSGGGCAMRRLGNEPPRERLIHKLCKPLHCFHSEARCHHQCRGACGGDNDQGNSQGREVNAHRPRF